MLEYRDVAVLARHMIARSGWKLRRPWVFISMDRAD